MLRTMPSKAIELTCFDVFKRVLSSARNPDTGNTLMPPALISTVSGALAGAAQALGCLQGPGSPA